MQFTEEEIQFLIATLINLRFQTGQSHQMVIAEHLIKKLNLSMMANVKEPVAKVGTKKVVDKVKEKKTA